MRLMCLGGRELCLDVTQDSQCTCPLESACLSCPWLLAVEWEEPSCYSKTKWAMPARVLDCSGRQDHTLACVWHLGSWNYFLIIMKRIKMKPYLGGILNFSNMLKHVTGLGFWRTALSFWRGAIAQLLQSLLWSYESVPWTWSRPWSLG